jgi:hypothetical protein
VTRTRDPDGGRDHYEQLGPLTDADMAYLAGQGSDNARRRTLSNWYGRSGAVHAWAMWRAARWAAEVSRGR